MKKQTAPVKSKQKSAKRGVPPTRIKPGSTRITQPDEHGLSIWVNYETGAVETRPGSVRVGSPGETEIEVNYETGAVETRTRPAHDPINRPAHYTQQGDVECIEVIEQLGHGHGFCVGNAIKYLWRAGRKEGTPTLTDLQKARWYVDRAIRQLRSAEGFATPVKKSVDPAGPHGGYGCGGSGGPKPKPAFASKGRRCRGGASRLAIRDAIPIPLVSAIRLERLANLTPGR